MRDEAVGRFLAAFGAPPSHLSSAPGRVNLIGEHTDYLDLPVFPMAVQRAVRILSRPRSDGAVHLANGSGDFARVSFQIGGDIEPGPPGSWENYVKAPAQEMARRMGIRHGFDGLVTSDVPVASGLASSSALVNAVGLALAAANGRTPEPLKMAALMADAERYTGMRGGGMDQAISLGAREGHATRIDFAPLRLRHVAVPPDWRFVVAHTGMRAEKSGPVRSAYNRRRHECEAALGRVVESLGDRLSDRDAGQGYPGLIAALGIDQTLLAGGEVLEDNLLRRYRHVVTEAGRVREAVDAMVVADPGTFGTLMDASHGSLRSDFHVSTAELDELVALAKEGGAAGARLTGAGFGGCIVALTTPMTLDGVIESLVAGYYEARGLGASLNDRLFVAAPSAGAAVVRI